MLTRIHVNQHIIRSNHKNGEDVPPLTIKTYKGNARARTVTIFDIEGRVAAKVLYRPDAPLSCGARVWIETENPVEAD